MERAKIERAAAFVDDVLAQHGGSDLMYVGGIYYQLAECELENELSRDELLVLTERIVEACGSSTVPLLTAERCDAVRFMLEYGISANRSPEFIESSPERAREVLLNCDMDIFTDLVDAVAVDGHDYYAPDMGFLSHEECERINSALEGVDEGTHKTQGHNLMFSVEAAVCNEIVDAALKTIRGVGVDQGSGCYELNSFEVEGEKLNLYADICKIEDGDGLRYAVYYAVEYDGGDNLFHDWTHTDALNEDALKKTVFEIANTDFMEDILKELHKGLEGSLEQKVLAAECTAPGSKSQDVVVREDDNLLGR